MINIFILFSMEVNRKSIKVIFMETVKDQTLKIDIKHNNPGWLSPTKEYHGWHIFIIHENLYRWRFYT